MTLDKKLDDILIEIELEAWTKGERKDDYASGYWCGAYLTCKQIRRMMEPSNELC